ncbi:MAG: ATP-grasp domain-containing protein [Spirochaetes bacterium]|jgi:biotin carboxylase|nr:ATP-grasp domain-containing protein [Spirochaetota bacterium]
MCKSFMVVGAGVGQLPAILKAKELGYFVVTVDRNENAVGMSYADVAYPIDVMDVESIIQVAKKHKINGVMTMQTDLPVPTVGQIIDSLSLPGNGLMIAKTCSDKVETRMRFEKKGVPQPKFLFVNNIDEIKAKIANIGFPCIIKAPDSSGSRGVTKVNENCDIEKAFLEAQKYSRSNRILVEEYIDGLEIGAQAFSIDGSCVKVLLHNDTVSSPPYMIPIGHSFPFIDNNNTDRIEVAVKKAVEALGIEQGPSNVDLIIDKTGNPYIIEIGARIGATCLPELVYYYSGINWVEATIKSAVGEVPDITQKKHNPVAAVIIDSPQDGVFQGYSCPDEILKSPKLLEFEVTVKKGDNVEKLRKGTDRIGKIVVSDESVSKAEQIAMEYKNEIIIEIL